MLSRRSFVGRVGLASSVVPFAHLFSLGRPAFAAANQLVADEFGLLDLPNGFSYQVIDRRGDLLSTGGRVPAQPDGMGLFVDEDGMWVLLRNHEIDLRDGGGGVTRLVVNPRTLVVEHSSLVLSGTDRNCNGGVSPWGWLSCEESRSKDRGYVYLCPSAATSVGSAKKIVGYGRFCHEAVVVDPITLCAYQTEDEPDSCFYRFTPKSLEHPFDGRLEALKVKGRPRFDTNRMQKGDVLQVEWVTVRDPGARQDSTRRQAQQLGAATFKNAEGMAHYGKTIYFSATKGGPLGAGQIFAYEEGHGGEGELTLVAVSESLSDMDCPDALTCSPKGDLYFAEDGKGDQYVRAIIGNCGPTGLGEGRLVTVARNARSQGELAGLCFSPDGDVMFVSLMDDGITVAVTGPFASL